MRILDITPRFPYPLTDGGRRGIYYPLRALARRGHTVHIASLVESVDPASVRELQKIFGVDLVVNARRPTAEGALASLAGRTPYQISRFHNKQLLRRAEDILSSTAFDILHVEGIHAAWYAHLLGPGFHVPTVMRLHDMLSLSMARSIEHAGDPFMKLWLRFDSRRVRSYERYSFPRVGCILTVSEAERDLVLRVSPDARCVCAPAGVDLEEFTPLECAEDPGSVLWLGALHWAPNKHSFWWFYNDIVPQLVRRHPDVRIKVAGTGAPPEILSLRHPNVEVFGFVPDVRQIMARSQVCVVPLKVGSGVRVKLLEMFAMRKAVVSTTVGAEGLGVEDGQQALIADSSSGFTDRIALLLEDAPLRERLGRSAREHVERHFSWDMIAGMYEVVYRSLLPDAVVREQRAASLPKGT
jgi:glycosyltransferase involved in cell wall biosynthesis